MSNVPTNLIPTRITGLPEYLGSSTLGYMPYIIDGRTYKVQFANIAAVGAVPSTREINTGSGLGGGGDLSANRTIYILPGGVDDSRLSATGVTAGTYGAADSVPVLTVNAQGRVTDVTLAPIVLSNYVPTSRTITAGAGLTGGGDLSANRSFAVNFSSTTPEPLGPGSPGVSTVAARGDHVHPAVDLSDTTETQGVLPLSRGGTGNSLSPVAGAIVYSSNDKLYLTTAGSVGQVLRSGGPGGVPFWTDVGAGTVTSVAVATANGFAGTVASPTLSPVITLSTTVTGMVKGNGTAVSAATAGVDYVEPGAYTASGLTMATARLLGRTTASVGAAQEISVGTGLTLSTGSLVNAAPDQVVSLTAGTAISVTGTYPSFTVTNTAPDQVVSLTGAGTTTVTGTYPSFTITSNDSTSGTVTSVNASGGTTGMSFTGGPVTSAGTLTLNGTLAVSNGGTGATDAVAALTNLGAYPASNPAGYTSNVGTVTSVSGTGTVSGLSLSGTVTSAGSLTLGGTLVVTPSDFASQSANTVLAAPNGSAGVPTFRAIVAADIPTLNQNTTGTAGNVSGIVAVANGGTGASVAATARSNLSAAASGANTDITSIALTTGTISTSPVSGTDIVNKAYADSIASGINFHQSVRLATAAALPAYTYNNGTSGVGATITANANAALSVDGVAVAVGNRILVKNESGAAEAYNGVYTVTQTGSGAAPYILTRATDFDSSGSGVDQIDAGDFFLVTAGSTQANTSWVQQTPLPITVGTTAIVFTQFAAPVLYSAGTGLTLTGTTFSITNTGVSASTYGSASSVPVIAVNAQGQLTSASSSSIAIAASQITSGALAIANGGTGATDASGALSNLGAYPASNPAGYTSNTGTVTSVNLTAGTGVSVSGGPITASGSITVTNTAPDQVVSLTGSGATTVTGTYPNFTISSPTAGAGTVTSIDVSGGTTGLTTSGGPVTSSGTITLAGTLNVANGGTGATTLSSGYVLKGNGTSAVSASVIYDNGTNVGIGTTSVSGTYGKLTVAGGVQTTDDANSKLELGRYSAGAPNSYIKLGPNSTSLRFTNAADDADLLTLTNAGNLGLGNASIPYTASGRTVFNVNGTSSTIMSLQTAGSNRGYLYADGSLISLETESGATLRLLTNAAQPILLYTNGAERLSINSSGNVTANVDFRAPIFYDSNNTAYYGDFASTSVLSVVRAATIQHSSGNNAIILNSGVWTQFCDVDGATKLWLGGSSDPNNYYNGNVHYFRNASSSTMALINSGGIQAPVYYDIDNTGYYGDFASTSVLFNLTISGGGNKYLQIQSTDSGEAMVRYMGATGPSWYVGKRTTSQLVDTASFHFYSESAGATVGGIDVSGNIFASGSMRAPIFYDSNNTAYYIDPANDTRLGGLLSISGSRPLTYSASNGSLTIQGDAGGWGTGLYFLGSSGTSFGGYGALGGGNSFSYLWAGSAYNDAALYLYASPGNYAVSPGSFRAPIFYDSNNTGYYVDPAGTSALVGPLIVGPTGGGAYTRFGQGAGDTTYSTISASNGNLHIDSQAGYDLYLNWYTARPVWSEGGAYFPIYYDRNDSAYYVNPAGFSNMSSANGMWMCGTTNPADTINGSTWYGTGRNNLDQVQLAGYYGIRLRTAGVVMDLAGDYAQINGSYRAPIFYDSDNTGYYINPASTSNIYQLTGAITYGSYGSFSASGTYNNYAGIAFPDVSATLMMNQGASGFYFNNNTWGMYCSNAGALYTGIFYDINNTGFYVDPASTSYLNTVSMGNQTWRGDITWNSSVNIIVPAGESSFDVSSGGLWHVWDSTAAASMIYAAAGAQVQIGEAGSRGLYVYGSITASGNVTAYSDVRVKANIETIPSALDKLDQIRGVTYTRTDLEDKERRYGGVIAQEIEAVLPEAVFETHDHKSVDYNATIGLLIEAVKELTNKVKALEAKE